VLALVETNFFETRCGCDVRVSTGTVNYYSNRW